MLETARELLFLSDGHVRATNAHAKRNTKQSVNYSCFQGLPIRRKLLMNWQTSCTKAGESSSETNLNSKMVIGRRVESDLVCNHTSDYEIGRHEYGYSTNWTARSLITNYSELLRFPMINVKDVIWRFELSSNFILTQPTVRLRASVEKGGRIID